MKRRNALKQIGAGLSAGFFVPWLSSCNEDAIVPETPYKGRVAIIGAGASGLFAADYLMAKGIDVILYEASDRIGGRIRTLRSFDKSGQGLWINPNSKLSSDFPVELGSDRIYGSNSIWAKFIRQQKFATQLMDSEAQNRYWFNETLLSLDDALAYPEFTNAYNFLQSLSVKTESGNTVQDAIVADGIVPGAFPMLDGRIGNRYGTSNSRIGIQGISEEVQARTRDSQNLILQSNAMSDVLIQGYLKASERTQLNTVIRNVNYEGEKVILTGEVTKGGSSGPFTTEVDRVIITVPVSVLKSGDITFTPDLPQSKQAALNYIGMDNALKLVLDFKRNFWGNGFQNIYGGDMPEYFNAGEGRSELARTLQVTVAGEKAEALSQLGYEAIPAVLQELDRMFDNQASRDVRTDANENKYVAAIQDWGKEPFIKGSMSYLKPGGTMEHRRDLSKSVARKVFFAGEATDFTGEAGSVNGALLAGERAARQVLEIIVG